MRFLAFVGWIIVLYKGMEDVLDRTFRSDEPSDGVSTSASLAEFGLEAMGCTPNQLDVG